MSLPQLHRRKFILDSTVIVAGAVLAPQLLAQVGGSTESGPYQAMGLRIGEVGESTALVWTRLTSSPSRNGHGSVIPKRAKDEKKRGKGETKVKEPVDELDGACPGAPGRVRVRYGIKEDLSDARESAIMVADEANDFICEFKLADLKPGATYHCISEVMTQAGPVAGSAVRGRFRTAQSAGATDGVRFCVMTCQGYADRGHPDGHDIYPSMAACEPHFTCLTGDLVYYDSGDPDAVSERLARYHWERMFSLPRLRAFNSNHATYWLKDDHDTLSNDSGPGATMGELTFAQGQRIFRQQAPMNDDCPAYRTVRWGKDLQVWFTEGRDHRSKNKSPDGPEKTIWGAEQKAWFKRTVKASDATWKVLVSPTPLVGPDRKNKHDNHANASFAHEGAEIRGWLKGNVPDNFFVICGDRHWQYHSVHPETGVREFSVGPASDAHASGSPGLDATYHQFHRVAGGFLCVTLGRVDAHQSRIQFEHRDVKGKVVHAWETTRQA
jgi:alkaline phosphatase D